MSQVIRCQPPVLEQGSGESKSYNESGEVKVGRLEVWKFGRINGQMDGWIDLLVGGDDDRDGKREEEGGEQSP